MTSKGKSPSQPRPSGKPSRGVGRGAAPPSEAAAPSRPIKAAEAPLTPAAHIEAALEQAADQTVETRLMQQGRPNLRKLRPAGPASEREMTPAPSRDPVAADGPAPCDPAVAPPHPFAPPDPVEIQGAAAKPATEPGPASAGAGRQMLNDFDRMTRNMGLLIEESGKVAAAYLKPREAGKAPASSGEDVKDMVKTLGQVAGYWLTDPARMIQAQTALSSQLIDLWAQSLNRFAGGPKPQAEPANIKDKRFAAPEWSEIPAFDFLRQAYLRTTDWANSLVEEAVDLDPQTRDKARFYLRQVTGALSPSNFLATNPELLRETIDQGGENLVRGMRMLAEDIAAGEGELKIRQSDTSPFQLGVNMAATPGKVMFRNDLMELIQYAPSTPQVYERPLLIVPPWINKFYVLDLNPDKSFIRWAVAQGLTVFVISWVNPDERHAAKDFEAYMREGIFDALDAIEAAIGMRDVSAIGYCVGGTLLAVTLAYMAAVNDQRLSSATFFTAQTDFRDAGDLKIFAAEEQIEALEAQMKETGYLKGSRMANAFNMLRPNELIWSYVVDNYLKGKAPMAFDLLAWNSDSTRMPAANHAFYLRNCYLGNKLTKGEMAIGGVTLDLHRVTIPIYNLATREDHIAPARSVFTGATFFGGPMRYVLAGSGHIAGVVNPPGKAKYQYWSGPPVEGSFDDWLKRAKETPGTWWPDWLAWLTAQAPRQVPARVPGEGKLVPLCDAPGDYVRVKA